MVLVKVLVLLAVVSASSAILFGRGSPTAVSDDRAIEDSCLALADQGSCDFYTCFERRLPCGRNWYMLRTGHYYCNKLQREKPNFSPEGQQFIENAQRCLTQSLKEAYQLDYIHCHDLEHQAVAAITTCFTDHAFCDVLDEDAQHFFNVYEFTDLFGRGAGKVWRAILSLATQCGGEALRELSSSAGETVINTFNSFFSSLTGGDSDEQ